MIRKYISKMTLDDVKNMALKQGIILDDNEVSNVYKYIKSNYNSFFIKLFMMLKNWLVLLIIINLWIYI